jgi:hypothetical protein
MAYAFFVIPERQKLLLRVEQKRQLAKVKSREQVSRRVVSKTWALGGSVFMAPLLLT